MKTNKLFKTIIIITLILSVSFRFINLDQKVYSADEVRKILRLTGYTSEEFKEKVFTGDIITASEIQNYQKLTPERNLFDAIHALARNPEHPPLYNLLTRFWMQLFNIPISSRIISILSSLLLLPCLYWLCLELFQSSLGGWIAILLVAVSPFHIHAAQNATQYSLWSVTIALSSAAILKALRTQKKNSWIIYSATVAMGFYTHLFFAIVAFSHGVYVFLLEKFKLTKSSISYCLSSLAALLLFSPWIIVIIYSLNKTKDNIAYYELFNPTLKKILDRLLSNLGNVFIDFHNNTRVEKYLDYLIFAIIIYSLYILFSKSKSKVWLFLLTLVVITPLAHILPNFISSSARPLQSRYYLPFYLGIELSVAYLITYLLTTTSLPKWQKILGKPIFVFLISLGIISGVFITQIHAWGLDDQRGTANGRNLELAPIINQENNPLVISEATHSFILGLSYLVNQETKFLLVEDKNQQQWQQKINFEEVNQQFNNIFIYYPDKTFLDYLKQQEYLTLESKKRGLYQLKIPE